MINVGRMGTVKDSIYDKLTQGDKKLKLGKDLGDSLLRMMLLLVAVDDRIHVGNLEFLYALISGQLLRFGLMKLKLISRSMYSAVAILVML